MSGKKDDSTKADLSLVPRVALEECARAFMLGEKKYGRYNYCKGHEASRLIAAAQRHLTSWFDGEDNDQESGRTHLGHALACVSMILRQQELGTLIDNRYKKEPMIDYMKDDLDINITDEPGAISMWVGDIKPLPSYSESEIHKAIMEYTKTREELADK